MKTILVFIMLTLAVSSNYGQTGKHNKETSLTIEIGNFPNNSGKAVILLYNSAKGYPVNPDLAYKINKTKISNNKASATWTGIPKGDYSISAFHDENDNSEFDKSWFGSPKESYGFSNIPGEFCGTPSFSQTSFKVGDEPKEIVIQLIRR
jgi:uncharacterized protein (DUF2141 family)